MSLRLRLRLSIVAGVLLFAIGCQVTFFPEPERGSKTVLVPGIQPRSIEDAQTIVDYKQAIYADIQFAIQEAMNPYPNIGGVYLKVLVRMNFDGEFEEVRILDSAAPVEVSRSVLRGIEALSPLHHVPEEIRYVYPDGYDPIVLELGRHPSLRKR